MTKHCPTCGKMQDFQSCSTNTPMVSLQIPQALVPAIADALQIGRNTAMISSAPETEGALDAIAEEIRSQVPTLAKYFTRYQWASFCMRAAEGRNLEVSHIVDGPYWNRRHIVTIIDPDGERWPGGQPKGTALQLQPLDSEQEAISVVAALKEECIRLAPID